MNGPAAVAAAAAGLSQSMISAAMVMKAAARFRMPGIVAAAPGPRYQSNVIETKTTANDSPLTATEVVDLYARSL